MSDSLQVVSREGVYGLISYTIEGKEHRYTWAHESTFQDMGAKITPSAWFLHRGWFFDTQRVIWFDPEGNRAQAYYNGHHVDHPRWP